MHIHYLQHVPFEGLGSIEPWLESAGHRISCSRLYASPDLPSATSIEALIIMGGPMSVNDELEYPWLSGEKQFVRDALSAGKPVLGICLGAQFIASALGSRVYRNAETEIGWFPIEGLASEEPSRFRFPASTMVFHWHGETFDLPPGATRIARSVACENQGFQLGRSIIGLQFHLEMTSKTVRSLVENCRNELTPSRFVQSEEAILSADYYSVIIGEMARLLAYLFGGTGVDSR